MTNPQFPNPFKKNIPQGTESHYKYYVIDINSDTPDAFFETFEEASVYQKEFAENHEYVIVKLDKGYKVYNMVENQNDTQTVQTSEQYYIKHTDSNAPYYVAVHSSRLQHSKGSSI